ncbi:hypothetical protein Hanom_Chr07g00610411 [Helianthus anomalus]
MVVLITFRRRHTAPMRMMMSKRLKMVMLMSMMFDDDVIYPIGFTAAVFTRQNSWLKLLFFGGNLDLDSGGLGFGSRVGKQQSIVGKMARFTFGFSGQHSGPVNFGHCYRFKSRFGSKAINGFRFGSGAVRVQIRVSGFEL